MMYRAGRLDLKLPMLESAMPSNEQHLKRAIDAVLDLPARRIGLIGLAFKENTDDLRESPVIAVLETLIGKGRNIRVFDPHIQLDQIYGSNQRFLLTAIPHIHRLLEPKLDGLLEWTECLVVMQRPSPEAWARIRASGVATLDLSEGSTTPVGRLPGAVQAV